MSQGESAGASADVHHLEAQRRANRDAIAALGVYPYGKRTEGVVTIAQARAAYDPAADQAWQAMTAKPAPGAAAPAPAGPDPRPRATVSGRIMLKRDGGKLLWIQLRDHSSAGAPDLTEDPAGTRGLVADIQVAVSARDCTAPGFDLARNLDLGDVILATGPLMKTKTGEITIWASKIEIATKSIAPPPEKWKGLQDMQLRYRRRYVDLYANPQTMRTFTLRARLASVIRRFLEDRGYIEVETPTLQQQAGGAAARPFVTHLNALSIDMFMRIAPELYLKRLLVGGMPKVFEWSRNFRNEGIDRSHNPEFSMIELYEAFGDYNTMRALTEELFRACAREVVRASGGDPADGLKLPYGDIEIDFGPPFLVVKYADLFEKAMGFSMNDQAKVLAECAKRGTPTKNKKGTALEHILLVNELFDIAEGALDPSRPTFVIDYPAPLCPLTRPKLENPAVAERFELFMGGMEMANAYTELNDPDIQEAKFKEQLTGIDDEEATFRNFDEDFVYALKVGMPPAGGLGIGIDRLCMVMLNQRSIRDVVLFPLMRPEE